MQITVRNARAIARADIVLAPLAIVAAPNYRGKTSLVAAAQAVLTGTPLVDGTLKKDAKTLVHDGDDSGFARARTETGEVKIVWPECSVEASGDAPPRATPIAAGLVSVVDLKGEARAKAFSGYVVSLPTQADLAKAMDDIGFGEEAVAATWNKIEDVGWDGAHAAATAYATEKKGQWKEITHETWGVQKAPKWRPEGWSDDVSELSVQDLGAALEAATKALEQSIATKAVDAERLAALRERAKEADGIDFVALAKARAEAEQSLERAKTTRAQLPVARSDGGLPCPHCGEPVMVEPIGPREGAYQLRKVEEVPEEDLKNRQQMIAAADGRVEHFRGDLAEADNALREANQKQRSADTALNELARLGVTKDGTDDVEREAGASEDEVAKARDAVARAELRLMARQRKDRADRIHGQIVRNIALGDILAPDGLRQKKMRAALEPFNATLAELANVAGYKPVRVDADLSIHYGERPVQQGSESEQFRARVLLQVAMAQIDRSDAVLVDRADILDRAGRNGLFGMLIGSGLKALVAMTMNRPDQMPDLAAKGIGEAWWIADGVAVPRAEAIAAAEGRRAA